MSGIEKFSGSQNLAITANLSTTKEFSYEGASGFVLEIPGGVSATSLEVYSSSDNVTYQPHNIDNTPCVMDIAAQGNYELSNPPYAAKWLKFVSNDDSFTAKITKKT